jgi:hypothetical protein
VPTEITEFTNSGLAAGAVIFWLLARRDFGFGPQKLVGFAAQTVRRLRSCCRERAREGRQARKDESPETGTWRSHGAAP